MDKDQGGARVAVIDDDKLSGHNLGVKLRFVGEEHVLLSSGNWHQWFLDPAQRASVYALLFGHLNATAAPRILAGLREMGIVLPAILTGEQGQAAALAAEDRPAVLAVLKRPLPYERLTALLDQARSRRGLPARRVRSAIISETGTAMFRSLAGSSEAIRRVRDLVQQVARRGVTVLICGESGTGKEIVARNLHYGSGRGAAPFVAVNAAALTMEALDPAFYRRERGETVGADCPPGYFDKARGGTLFLDLVDEMPGEVQALLLRYLESRIGEAEPENTAPRARLVVAARTTLEDKVQSGEFREDLYYRLNVFPIQVPPLRERAEDIPELLNELAARIEHSHGVTVRFNSAACQSLRRHPWPGNVRELANLVERLSILRPNQVIGLSDLPANYQHLTEEEFARMEREALVPETADVAGEGGEEGGDEPMEAPVAGLSAESLRRYLTNFEKQLIEAALDTCDWDIPSTAEHLQTSAAQLDQLMKKHGLKARE